MKNKHLPIIVAMSFMAIAASCNNPELEDGYQLGDISRITMRDINRIIEDRERACNYIGSDAIKRTLDRAAILAIQHYVPMYPDDGLCGPEFDRMLSTIRRIHDDREKLNQGHGMKP
jgi:hypothetical protein